LSRNDGMRTSNERSKEEAKEAAIVKKVAKQQAKRQQLKAARVEKGRATSEASWRLKR
jgi:hypothetical protein